MSPTDDEQPAARKRLRFLHIPKSAGTTFSAILGRNYHCDRTFGFTGDFAEDSARFRALAPDRRDHIELIIGHAALHTGLAEVDDAITFTLLREPVARARSFCQHASEGKAAYLLEEHPPEKFDLDHFLWSGDPHVSNQQTKMLINTGDIGDESVIREIGEDAACDLALRNLFERVDCYGLQEEFDSSVLMLAQRYGWSVPWYFSKNRRRGKRLVFEPRHIERIRELNRLDLKVYEAARAAFMRRMNVQSNATVASFRLANRTFAPVMAAWDDAWLRALYWYRRAKGAVR